MQTEAIIRRGTSFRVECKSEDTVHSYDGLEEYLLSVKNSNELLDEEPSQQRPEDNGQETKLRASSEYSHITFIIYPDDSFKVLWDCLILL